MRKLFSLVITVSMLSSLASFCLLMVLPTTVSTSWEYTEGEAEWIAVAKKIEKPIEEQTIAELQITSTAIQIEASHKRMEELTTKINWMILPWLEAAKWVVSIFIGCLLTITSAVLVGLYRYLKT